MNRRLLALVSSFALIGAAGCTLNTPAEKPEETNSPSTNANGRTGKGDDDIIGSGGDTDPTTSGNKTRSEPSSKLTYKGPFVVGDGSGERGDAQCFSSLAATKPPTTGRKSFKIELQAGVMELQVKAVKLCGNSGSYEGGVLLLKDGATIAKSQFEFGDSPDLVTDSSVSFAATDEEKGFEPGEYDVVLAAPDTSYDEDIMGQFNDYGVGTLEIGVIGGTAKIMKVGEPSTAPRAEVDWAEAFSVGDNKFESATQDEACRSSLKAGPATAGEKRFTVEISDGVADLAIRLDKTCGGTGNYQAEVRVYEGDNLLLAKNTIEYTSDYKVISHVFHVNAGNAGRKLAAGKYTFEIAAEKSTFDIDTRGAYNDIAASGVKAWVVGEGATIKKL